jgi:hypothetical protein
MRWKLKLAVLLLALGSTQPIFAAEQRFEQVRGLFSKLFADFAQIVIGRARTLYRDDPFGEELRLSAYALDSTTPFIHKALTRPDRLPAPRPAWKMS